MVQAKSVTYTTPVRRATRSRSRRSAERRSRKRSSLQLSIYLSRAIERFVGHPGAEAFAFWGSAMITPTVTEIVRNGNPVGKHRVNTQSTPPRPTSPPNTSSRS